LSTILVVDDDESYLSSLVDGLMVMDESMIILTALNGEMALKILERNQIDLVLTDIRMPVMDGFQLLSNMINRFCTIPVIVISAMNKPTKDSQRNWPNVLQYLQKPLDITTVASTIKKTLSDYHKSTVHGITLMSFLQLLALENKTCILTARKDDREAIFYIESGVLLDTELGEQSGIEAAYEVLTWENPLIEMHPVKHKRKRTIEEPLETLLLNACKLLDEKAVDVGDDIAIAIPDSSENIKETDINKGQPVNNIGKEEFMNIQKVNAAIEAMRESLGAALLATDCFGAADGQSIAGINTQPKASALFNQVTDQLEKSLKASDFPPLGRYYMLDLEGAVVIVVPLGKYRQGMLLDPKKAQLGLVLNVVLPKLIEDMTDALS
jgi:CheY-like chemotaxis protein